jgi:O-antigen/teichoic acid export membrane protein
MTAAATEQATEPRRRTLWSGLANGGSRALLLATPAVTLPLVTDSLGPFNYGAYAVITGIVYFLPWADFGLPLSMVTTISQAIGRGDRDAVRAIVSTGLAMLLAVGAAVAGLALLLWQLVDWPAVLGLTDPRVTADVHEAVLFMLLSLAVGIPANVGMRVMLGLQMNRTFALWQAAAVPVVIAAVVVGHRTGAGLTWFAVATTGTPVVMAVLSSVWLFRWSRPEVAPRLRLADRERLRPMLALGGAFAVNGIAWTISYDTSSVVISHVVGADAAGVYNISVKLSSLGFWTFESMLLPLWPLFAARLAAGDYAGTRAGLRAAALASVVLGIGASAAFVWAAPAVIRVWLGAEFVPSQRLLLALAVVSLVQFAAQPFIFVLNGAGAKKILMVSALLMAACTLPLSILLAHVLGVAGPSFALAISMAGCVLIPSAVVALRRTRPPG